METKIIGSMKLKIKKIIIRILDVSSVICCLMGLMFLGQLFCFTSFKIPSNSMEPTLKAGDRILVNKMVMGARLFDVAAALEQKDVNIYRLPALGALNRNDVIVFNFPYQEFRWDSIRMDVMQYYVKRCIALPGDVLEIREGVYKVKGCNKELGNSSAQQNLADLEHPEQYGIVVNTFPYDEQLGWTIHEFGPLLIPKKGQTAMMNRTSCLLYRQLIGWEQKKKLSLKDGQVLLGDSIITRYRFEKNYYFVSGDNMANSQDSRYWGMLPEEYIVGKATHIWYSEDKVTEKPCWNRIMTKIK